MLLRGLPVFDRLRYRRDDRRVFLQADRMRVFGMENAPTCIPHSIP
jgi:hypothetical protein